jgi:hypothetical protein
MKWGIHRVLDRHMSSRICVSYLLDRITTTLVGSPFYSKNEMCEGDGHA